MNNLGYLQKLYKDPRLQQLEWSKCYNDPYYWLTTWAYTLDAHDTENPMKPYPDKEYLKIIVEKWLKHPLLLIPKSRQMMLSWIMTSLYLWDTQFHHGRLTFFQSKKADDANDLVKRAKIVWDNEPSFLKKYYEDGKFHDLICNPQNQGNHVYNLMTFPQIHSEIRGIPEGGDVIRMHTCSGILCLGPKTRILTKGLKWIEIQDAKIGEELVGFDENLDYSEKRNRPRRWKNTRIEAIKKTTLPSYKLTFSDGTEVISSENHRWLAGYGQASKWIKTKNLREQNGDRAGSRVWKILEKWDNDKDLYESGYLGAAIDGEGSLDQYIDVLDSGEIKTSRIRLSFSQNENSMLERVRDYYEQLGISYIESISKSNRYSKPHHVLRTGVKSDIIKLLGKTNSSRLKDKLNFDKWGQMNAIDGVTLVKKEFVGDTDVIGIKTSTGTFIAEGLASHNSDEMAFQPEAKSAYTAAKPTISSKGRFTGVSTAEDNTFFEEMVFDRLETE